MQAASLLLSGFLFLTPCCAAYADSEADSGSPKSASSFATLVTKYGLPGNSSESGLSAGEAEKFAETMKLLDAMERLQDPATWTEVSTGGVSDPIRKAVADFFGMPEEQALSTGLSARELLGLTGQLQVFDRERWVKESFFWTSVKSKGVGAVVAEAARDFFGIPADIKPGATTQELLDGLATVQVVGGKPDDHDLWTDIEKLNRGDMSPDEFLTKWAGAGAGDSGEGGASADAGSDTDDGPGSESEDTDGSGSGGGADLTGPGGSGTSDTGDTATGPSPEKTHEVFVNNLNVTGENSFSYEWDIYNADGTELLKSGTTTCNEGTCVDVNTETGASSTYESDNGPPNEGVTPIYESDDSQVTGGDATADVDSSSDADSTDGDSGSDSDSEDDAASEDDSDDEDEGDSEDESDNADSDDALPIGPDREHGKGRSAAELLESIDQIFGPTVQPADADSSSTTGKPPVYKHPGADTVLPADDSVATNHSFVPEDPSIDMGDVLPADSEDLVSSSTGGAGVAKGITKYGETVSPASGASSSSSGDSTFDGSSLGAGSPPLWECRRALIEDYKGGLWCYCPVLNDPVTGMSIVPWVRLADSVDTSAEALMNKTETPSQSCKIFTESEWSAAYPTYSLPTEVPLSIVN